MVAYALLAFFDIYNFARFFLLDVLGTANFGYRQSRKMEKGQKILKIIRVYINYSKNIKYTSK